jgi:hypothetical protein
MGGEHWIDYNYTLDTYDWASISCEAGPTGCPGTFITKTDLRMATNLPDPGYSEYFGIPNMTGIDANIKPVKTGEFTAGMDHELGPLMSLGVRYVHKWAMRAQDDVGVMLGLKGFAAAMLGGLGSFGGAVAGGLMLGLLESLGAGFLSSAYKDAIAFVVILGVLFFMPGGLVGARRSERV